MLRKFEEDTVGEQVWKQTEASRRRNKKWYDEGSTMLHTEMSRHTRLEPKRTRVRRKPLRSIYARALLAPNRKTSETPIVARRRAMG